ncbi:MAG TPA: hypothetical protein VJA26_15940 [Gammaproteobacteria bacterium]|nr:hypothetical protein [Gammaproteobacteria bacterium]
MPRVSGSGYLATEVQAAIEQGESVSLGLIVRVIFADEPVLTVPLSSALGGAILRS